MAEPIRLLVVDDALEHARMVEQFIRSSDAWADADIRIAVSYDEALDAFRAREFDVAFFDYWLGARDGLSLSELQFANDGRLGEAIANATKLAQETCGGSSDVWGHPCAGYAREAAISNRTAVACALTP